MRIKTSILKKIIRRVLVESIHPHATREDLIQLIADYTEDDEELSYDVIVMEFMDYIDRDDFTDTMAASMLDDLLAEPNSPVKSVDGYIQMAGGAKSGNTPRHPEPLSDARVIVHFPSEHFSHGYLESNFMEAPSRPKFVVYDQGGEEFQVEGSYDDLAFIWSESYGDPPDNFDDYILHRY